MLFLELWQPISNSLQFIQLKELGKKPLKISKFCEDSSPIADVNVCLEILRRSQMDKQFAWEATLNILANTVKRNVYMIKTGFQVELLADLRSNFNVYRCIIEICQTNSFTLLSSDR